MTYVMQARRGTIAEFSALNRVYLAGELLLEDQGDGTYKLKAADGVRAYNSLPYVGTSGSAGSSFATIAVPSQTSVVADSAADTLTLSGTGITITTNAASDSITLLPTYGSVANTVCQGNDSRLTDARVPTAHALSHKLGQSDAIKLDELAAPSDITTLNASTSAHGLLPKLNNDGTAFLNGQGAWATPATLGIFTNVKTFGATGNGVTDDTAAIQAAIDSLPSTGGIVYFPPGIYKVSSTITINKPGFYFGAGVSTSIRTSHVSNNVFAITASTVTLSDIKFEASTTRSAGAYILISSSVVRIERFVMYAWMIGIQISRAANPSTVTIQSGAMYDGIPTFGIGIMVESGFDISIRDVLMYSTTICGIGIQVTQCGDVTIENCNIIHCGNALELSTNTGSTGIYSVWASNTFFDTSTRGAMLYADIAGIYRCIFNQCWFSSSTQQGIQLLGVASPINGVDIVNCHVFLNAADGISIGTSTVTNVKVIGGEIAQNLSGISVANGVSGVSIIGVRSGNTAGLSGNTYGIYIGTGCSNYIVTNCDLRGNSTASIIDGSTSTKVINNNLGSLSSTNVYTNVRSFGAVGDGTTNDTTAIQNAINSALVTGGTVYFPTGIYLVTSISWTIHTSSLTGFRVGLVGDGPALSVIRSSSLTVDTQSVVSITADYAFSPTAALAGVQISNLSFESTNLIGNAFKIVDLGYCYFENCYFSGGFAGFRGDSFLCSAFTACRFVYAKIGLLAEIAGGFAFPNQLIFTQCQFYSNERFGLYAYNPGGLRFFGGSVEVNGFNFSGNGGGIVIDHGGNSTGTSVAAVCHGVYFEDNTGFADVWVVDGNTTDDIVVSVTDCSFLRSTSQITNPIRVDYSGTKKLLVNVQGCTFHDLGTPTGSQKYIECGSSSTNVLITAFNNFYQNSVALPDSTKVAKLIKSKQERVESFTGTTDGSGNVTFALAGFTATPMVSANVADGSSSFVWAVNISAISSSSVTLRAFKQAVAGGAWSAATSTIVDAIVMGG